MISIETAEKYFNEHLLGEFFLESGSALSPPLPKEEIMPPAVPPPKKRPPKVDLSQLLEQISPEDSALISLIVFLLCDNTENDVVLLGILLYVLLSK